MSSTKISREKNAKIATGFGTGFAAHRPRAISLVPAGWSPSWFGIVGAKQKNNQSKIAILAMKYYTQCVYIYEYRS